MFPFLSRAPGNENFAQSVLYMVLWLPRRALLIATVMSRSRNPKSFPKPYFPGIIELNAPSLADYHIHNVFG